MKYWLKDIIPSQILLKVCSVQFKWSDCGQQWCIGKECKNRANILPPLLCTLLAKPTSLLRFPGQSQHFGHGSCSCWWVGLLFVNFTGFGYSFGNNYKDFVLKLMDLVWCPVVHLIATVFLHSKWLLIHFIIFTLCPANTFILQTTPMFSQAEGL